MNDNWSFVEHTEWLNEPSWYCNGQEQSPINIDTEILTQCKSLCEIEFKYKPTKCNVTYKNNLLRFKVDQGSNAIFKGVAYGLTEMTIHTPSMHTINNEKYDAEICLIHRLSDDNEEKKVNDYEDDDTNDEIGLIVSCMYRRGAHHGEPQRFISEVLDELPSDPIKYYKDIEVSDTWGADLVLPKKKSFYMYNGSLMYPPCKEGYIMIVMDTIGMLGETTLDILVKNQGKNVRPINGLYDREIFYNPGSTGDNEEEVDVNTSNEDRYLKCVKQDVDPEILEQPPVIDDKVEESYDEKGCVYIGGIPVCKGTLEKIFLPLTTFVLFLTSIYFVKFLFREKKVGKKIITGGILKKIFVILVGGSVDIGQWDSWNETANVKRDM